MASNNLAVTISADVTNLKTNLAIAQAQLRQTNKELSSLAAAAAQVGPPTAQAAAAINAAAAAAVQQQANIKRLTAEIRGMGSDTESVFAKNRAAFMELEHSGRAVADGLAAGASPIRLLAMEAARLGQAYTNLDAAGKAAVMSGGAYAAVAIAGAAAVGTLIYKLVEEHNALANIQTAYAELGRGVDFSLADQKKQIDDVSSHFHMWKGDVISIKEAIAGIPNLTNDLKTSLVEVASAQFKLGDQSAKDIAKKMVEMFSGSSEAAVQYASKLGLLKGGEVDAAMAAAKAGHDMEAFKAVIEGMNARALPQFEDHMKRLAETKLALTEAISNAAAAEGGMVPDTVAQMPANTAPDPNVGKQADDPQTYERNEEERKLNATLIERQAILKQVADMQALVTDATEHGTAAEQSAAQSALATATIKLNALHTPEEIQAHEATLERIKSEVAASVEGSQARVNAAAAAYEEMKRFAGGSETAQVIRAAAQVEAAGREQKSKQLADAINGYRDQEAAARDNADKLVEIQRQLVAKIKAAGDTGAGQLGAEQTKLTDLERQAGDLRIKIRMGELARKEGLARNDFDQQRAIVAQEVKLLEDAGKQQTAEYTATKDKLAAIDREELQRKNAMAAEWASNLTQAAKAELQTEKDRLDAEVDAGRMTAQQKYDALVKFADASFQLDLKTLQDEYDLQDRSVEDQLKTYDKLYQLGIKHNQDMAKLNLDLANANANAAKKTAEEWKRTNTSIAQSASGSIMSMLKSQETFQQAALSMGEKLTQKALSWAIERALAVIEGKSTETAATVTAEAAKTAAAEAGATATKQANADAAQSGIMAKASDAAAGAYDAIVSIPYVGPVLAPAAAAVAFAGVSAYGAMISSSGGIDTVPRDNVIARLHAQETVLSAPYARGLKRVIDTVGSNDNAGGYGLAPIAATRLSAPAAASSSSGAGGGDMHFHFAPVVSAVDATGVDRMLQQHQDVFIKNVNNWHRNGKLKVKR